MPLLKPRRPLVDFFERKIKAEMARAHKTKTPSRELSWIKSPKKIPESTTIRVSELLKQKNLDPVTFLYLFEMERAGALVVTQFPKRPKGKSIIHTHPHRSGMFSAHDMGNFFYAMLKKKSKVRFSVIIPHNTAGQVVGCSLVYYAGKREDLQRTKEAFEKEFAKRVEERMHEIRQFPERFSHIHPGDRALTLYEEAEFTLNFLSRNHIRIRFFPRKGYRYDPQALLYQHP